MSIYRLHIRPKGGKADTQTVFDYCLRKKILGVGWRITHETTELDWENYSKKATKKFKKINVVKYLKDRIKINDLIWTRDNNGDYYLAKVKSEWKYFNTTEANEKDIDIANVVEVSFAKIETEEVPGKVIACFRATRTLQAIKSKTIYYYSKYLWNEKNKDNKFENLKINITDYFDLIDSEELEDLIFIFLQIQDYIVVPNSRKGDTMSYEFYVKNKETKKSFLIQVKSGNTSIDLANYNKSDENYILFQSNNIYVNRNLESEKISVIDNKVIKKFIDDYYEFLPKTIQKKIEIIRKINS